MVVQMKSIFLEDLIDVDELCKEFLKEKLQQSTCWAQIPEIQLSSHSMIVF